MSPALGLLLLHVAASLLAALLSVLLTARAFRTQPRRVFVLHAVLALCMPVLGIPGVLLLAWASRFTAPVQEMLPFATAHVPAFTHGAVSRHSALNAESLHTRLTNANLSREQRLKALLLARTLPAHRSNPVLREAMNATQEDIRLTAYGLYHQGEQHLYAGIQEAAAALATAPDAPRKALHLKRLGRLYWELVFQGYAHVAELRAFALDRAEQAVRQTLALLPEDAESWWLLARVCLAKNRLDLAEWAFSHAARCGEPSVRIAPYLAELAFRKRQFARVRHWIAASQSDGGHVHSHFQPVQAFWTRPGGS